MNSEPNEERESKALDALIAASLRQGELAELTDEEIAKFAHGEVEISSEARAALSKLGERWIGEIARSPVELGDDEPWSDSYREETSQVMAMHRKNSSGQHDPQTEAELEKKRQEILARLKAKERPTP